jgi:hypothetical protein
LQDVSRLLGRTVQQFSVDDDELLKMRKVSDFFGSDTLERLGLGKVNRILKDAERGDKKRKTRLDRFDRIGPAVLAAPEVKDHICGIADSLYGLLDMESERKLRPLVLVRSLYEHAEPAKEYLFTDEEHDERLLSLVKKEQAERIRAQPMKDLLYLHGWRLQKCAMSEARRTKVKLDRLNRDIEDVVEEIDLLNRVRYDAKRAYHRAMDKALFAKSVEGSSVDELERRVLSAGLDLRVGYIAMIADFIPYIFEGMDDLELKLYMGAIKPKVFARRLQKG